MLVDTHIHYLPDALRSAYRRRQDPPLVTERDGKDALVYGGGHVEPLGSAAGQRERLDAAIAEAGTDVALVSINQPGVIGFPHADALAVARDANDEMADLASGSGGRIIGLGTLPWQDPDATVAELERIMGLGMRGAMLLSNVGGEAIDSAKWEPVYAAAATLRARFLLHPTLPLTAPHLSDYKGLLAAAGYLFDTTTAALRLLLSGIPHRLPDLGVVLGHSGSLLPALAARLDEEWTRGGLELPLPAGGPPSALLRWLYSDTAGGSAAAVQACIAVLGVDRVMFGTDYPFWEAGRAADVFAALDLTPEDRAKIAGDTAVGFFDLAGHDGAGR